MELAQTLQADVPRLKALLSDDDVQDMAEGLHSYAYLLAYFRLMRSDGKPLKDDLPQHPDRHSRIESYSPTLNDKV